MGKKCELTYLFWSENKAKTLKSTGIGATLKAYELATERFDDNEKLKRLNELKSQVNKAIKNCKKWHGDTKKILETFKNLIDKQVKATLASAKKGSASVPKKQEFGKPVVIWKRNVLNEIKKEMGKDFPDWLDKNNKTEIKLILDGNILNILEQEKDYVTPAFMVEDAQKCCKETVDKMVKFIGERTSRNPLPPKVIEANVAEINKKYKSELKDLAKKLKPIPENRWQKFVKRKKQYKKYKVKAGCDLTISLLSTALSGLALAAAVPSGGATLILGVINGTRSIAALTKQCYNLSLEAESVHKALKADLDTLEGQYKGAHKKAKLVGKEMTMATIKGILNIDTPFVATVSKCKKNHKLLGNKVAGLAVKGRKLGKEFVKLLEKAEKAEKKMKGATDNKDAMKILDGLRKIRKSVSDAFDKAADMNARVKTMDEENLPEVEKLLKALSEDVPNYVQVFERTWHATVNVGLAVGTGALGLANADSTLKIVNGSIQMTRKLETELKKQIEISMSKK